MSQEKIKPEYLGHLQCLNVDNQCYYGLTSYSSLANEPGKMKSFDLECGNLKGSKIRCCHPDLINVPYLPGPLQVPYMVQGSSNESYRSCPTKITASCFRESERDQPLCIQNVCLDNGYRVASNYYEICKSLQINDKNETIPDCTTAGCWGNRFRVGDDSFSTSLSAADTGGVDMIRALEPQARKQLEESKVVAESDLDRLKRQLTELKTFTSAKIKSREAIAPAKQLGGANGAPIDLDDQSQTLSDKLDTLAEGDTDLTNIQVRINELEKLIKEKEGELAKVAKTLETAPEFCKPKPGQYCFDTTIFTNSLKIDWNTTIKLLILAILTIFVLIMIFSTN